MSQLQYIGARYVPIWYHNSVDDTSNWEMNVEYEPLTFVTTLNNHLYISKKTVPDNIGSPADNTEYWVDMGLFTGQSIDHLQDEIDELTDNLFNTKINSTINGLSVYQRCFSNGGHSTMQGGCVDPVSRNIFCYVDGEICMLKSDGTSIMNVTPTEAAHHNDMTVNTKRNTLIVCGSGGAPSFTGIAIYSALNLSYIETVTIPGTTMFYAIAYDENENVYIAIEDGGTAYVIDADDYSIKRHFDVVWTIDNNTPIRQGCFIKAGTLYLNCSPFGIANRYYEYDIKTGDFIGIESYNYGDVEVEFTDVVDGGVLIGYLKNGYVYLDYMSNIQTAFGQKTFYVDCSASDNGLGTYDNPYNNLAFVAMNSGLFDNVVINSASDLSGESVTFDNMKIYIGLGARSSNITENAIGWAILFKNCNVTIYQGNYNTHLRFENSRAVITQATIDGHNTGYAIVNANASHLSVIECEFKNCDVCIRNIWGSLLGYNHATSSYQSGNNYGFTGETSAILIMSGASITNLATKVYRKDTQCLTVVNGDVKTDPVYPA